MKVGDEVYLVDNPKWQKVNRYKVWGVNPGKPMTITSISSTRELTFSTGIIAPEFDFYKFTSKLHKVLE